MKLTKYTFNFKGGPITVWAFNEREARTLARDDFSEVQDFIWKNCQEGLNCELVDNETGDKNWAYADDFTEDTEDVDELLRDLHMEQIAQM